MNRTANEFYAMGEEFEPLDKKREDALLAKVRNGDSSALGVLVNHNARRILMFANEAVTGFTGSGKSCIWSRRRCGVLPLEECVMIAAESFCHAARKFDPSKYSDIAHDRVRFGSWANWIIKQKLGRALSVAKMREQKWDKKNIDDDIHATEDYVYDFASNNRVIGDPDFCIDPMIEIAKDRFWERCYELLGPGPVTDLQNFISSHQNRSDSQLAWRRGRKAVELLKERMPEKELLEYAKFLG